MKNLPVFLTFIIPASVPHTRFPVLEYNGSVVKTKIYDFYNELVWLISYLTHKENHSLLPAP